MRLDFRIPKTMSHPEEETGVSGSNVCSVKLNMAH